MKNIRVLTIVSVACLFAACGAPGGSISQQRESPAEQRIGQVESLSARCAAISAEYRVAVQAAKVCVASGTPFPQCTTPTAADLRCGCLTLVNIPSPALGQIAERWEQAGCPLKAYPCPINCKAVELASCQAGSCVAR